LPLAWFYKLAAGGAVKIFLVGGTGFLGRYMQRVLVSHGHEVTLLARQSFPEKRIDRSIRIVMGNPTVRGAWQKECAGHEVVINLAGTSIFRPWTKTARKEIFESRIRSTENIVEAMKDGDTCRKHLFNASGVGYYGYTNDALIDETAPAGDTFLARLARLWETAALGAREAGIRVVLCRFGIVLGREGGAFPRILRLVKLYLGAQWGSGRQWFSWIHEEDVAGILIYLLNHDTISGPINFTSPLPIANHEMLSTLNMTLNRKPLVPAVPQWFIRSILGEFSNEFIEGQRAVPGILTKNGYSFQFPTFSEAIADLIKQE
jgi:uncharacterized protein